MASSAQQTSAAVNCRICKRPVREIFQTKVLGRDIRYFQCPDCGYVQTEEPYWLDEAYNEAINLSDCGLVLRNERTRRLVVRIMAMLGILGGDVIDCAGGYGLLVRMLRDWGVNAFWDDPYCENMLARGFEAKPDQKASLVTAFEAFEHFTNPSDELGRLLNRADNVLISTALVKVPAPDPQSWWYYCFEHGQHVGFLSKGALQVLARDHGCHVVSDGRSFHLFTRKSCSQIRFRLAMGTRFLARPVSKLRLRSRTWEDYETLRAMEKKPAPPES